MLTEYALLLVRLPHQGRVYGIVSLQRRKTFLSEQRLFFGLLLLGFRLVAVDAADHIGVGLHTSELGL